MNEDERHRMYHNKLPGGAVLSKDTTYRFWRRDKMIER